MNCDRARTLLRDQFDAGAPLGEGVGVHLASCDACRRYRERLLALDACLPGVELASPSAEFVARVQDRIAPPMRLRPVHIAAACALVAAIAALGWWYPLDLTGAWRQWGTPVYATLAEWEWSDVFAAFRGAPEALLTTLPRVPRYSLPVSRDLTWIAVAGGLTFLVVFNGVGLKWLSRRDSGMRTR